jgi:ATP-dependent Clp protease ATP-binding subunit ClpA
MIIKKTDFDGATNIAKFFNNTHITVEALFYHLFGTKEFQSILKALYSEEEITNFKNDFGMYLASKSKPMPVNPIPSYQFEIITKKAISSSLMSGHNNISLEELIKSIMSEEKSVAKNVLETHNFNFKINTNGDNDELMEDFMNNNNNNTTTTAPHNSNLIEFAKHTILLNEQVSNYTTPLGEVGKKYIDEIERVLLRKTKNSIIISGDPGVGKTHVIYKFVDKLNKSELHKNLANIKIYELNLNSLLSDVKYHGILEARISAIVDVLSRDQNKILFIDEIHMLYGAGGNSNLDVMNFLKGPMSQNKMRIIGATTTQEYTKFVEKNAAFARRFSKLSVEETNEQETIDILMGRKKEFHDFYSIDFADSIISEVVKLSNLYVRNRKNPDKAIDILDSTLARAKAKNLSEISMSDVFTEVSTICNIPSDELSKNKAVQLDDLLAKLNAKIIGQDNAFEDVINTLFVSSSGLRTTGKTLGNFLFQGPTSTGKTYTAQMIADTLNIPLLRYDMSGFMEKHTISTLIGSPPGYIGFGDGQVGNGKLISDIEKYPHCVLLMDEIEKAHKDVLNILLQIMDYGKLSSSSGKEVYFSKVILIMTSNLGSQDAQKSPIGFNNSQEKFSRNKIDENINKFLAPEFRARIDNIIHFNTLNLENLKKITRMQLDELFGKLNKNNVTVEITDEVIEKIAKDSFESKLGVRDIEANISKHIKTKLARIVLNKDDTTNTHVKTTLFNNAIDIQ